MSACMSTHMSMRMSMFMSIHEQSNTRTLALSLLCRALLETVDADVLTNFLTEAAGAAVLTGWMRRSMTGGSRNQKTIRLLFCVLAHFAKTCGQALYAALKDVKIGRCVKKLHSKHSDDGIRAKAGEVLNLLRALIPISAVDNCTIRSSHTHACTHVRTRACVVMHARTHTHTRARACTHTHTC